QRQQKRAQGRTNTNDRLERGVQPQGRDVAIRTGTEQQPTETESTDEDGDDRGRRGSRGAEDEAEFAHPGHLVDQCAEAGAEKERRNAPQSRAHVAGILTRSETVYWDRETVIVPMSRVGPPVSTVCARLL